MKNKKRILITLICTECEINLENKVGILDGSGKLHCKRCFGNVS